MNDATSQPAIAKVAPAEHEQASATVSPNYGLYGRDQIQEVKDSWLSCILTYLRSLDRCNLVLVLTIVGLTVIGVHLSGHAAAWTFGVAAILAAMCLVVILIEKRDCYATGAEKGRDKSPDTRLGGSSPQTTGTPSRSDPGG